MSLYIDIHTHQAFEESREVFALKSLRLCELSSLALDKRSSYTLGLHPYFREDISEESWEAFRSYYLTSEGCFWGIGECGLDKRSQVPMEEQIDFLIRQIKLSEGVQKTLVLHVVKAWNNLLSIKRRLQPKQAWIIHGFRGNPILAKQLLEAGFYLSFGEYYNLDSFLLAESYGRAFLETDESATLSIQDIYQRSAQELGLELGELKERYQQRFLNLS